MDKFKEGDDAIMGANYPSQLPYHLKKGEPVVILSDIELEDGVGYYWVKSCDMFGIYFVESYNLCVPIKRKEYIEPTDTYVPNKGDYQSLYHDPDMAIFKQGLIIGGGLMLFICMAVAGFVMMYRG